MKKAVDAELMKLWQLTFSLNSTTWFERPHSSKKGEGREKRKNGSGVVGSNLEMKEKSIGGREENETEEE